ncbi:hypothetical protein SO694_00084159 [Aureococcus anophagefferens]|uniref:Uncharacterized protein n=1 Tax=Aureococcus anophagefferens TaxID=44056 RepID=A0ABR1G402_AURAN
MVVDGGSAGQFEALLSAQLDLSLSRAVTAARLEGEERGGGSASAAPRRVVATISPFDADITARCAEILGPRDFGADGLAAMKTALAGDDEPLDAGGGGDALGRAVGATMKRGLVDVCSEAAALYVWDRRSRPRAASLPSVLLDAALPGALDAAPVPDDAPHSLADGAAFAEKATLPHLVYSAYNALRVKHDLAVVAAAQHRDIVAAEEAIAARPRRRARAAAEEQRRLEAEAEAQRARDARSATEAEAERAEGEARAAKREAAAATAAGARRGRVPRLRRRGQGRRDAAARPRGPSTTPRRRTATASSATPSPPCSSPSTATPTLARGDAAALDAKAEKAYRKKFPKFEKALRKKWKHDAALSAPYVVPDEAALAVVLGGWRLRGRVGAARAPAVAPTGSGVSSAATPAAATARRGIASATATTCARPPGRDAPALEPRSQPFELGDVVVARADGVAEAHLRHEGEAVRGAAARRRPCSR